MWRVHYMIPCDRVSATPRPLVGLMHPTSTRHRHASCLRAMGGHVRSTRARYFSAPQLQGSPHKCVLTANSVKRCASESVPLSGGFAKISAWRLAPGWCGCRCYIITLSTRLRGWSRPWRVSLVARSWATRHDSIQRTAVRRQRTYLWLSLHR